MRLLHTSDWHLGQHFMGKTRQAEHQALIDWLLDTVVSQAVDAVLIAGDIFDTGTPPSYARELYNQLVERLHDAKVRLILLGGNHDSVAVLGESKNLLARLGTLVVPGAAEPAAHVHVLPRRDGTPGAVIGAVPYLRPRDLISSEAGQSAEDKQRSLRDALREHYAAVNAACEAKISDLGQPLPRILTGHLTTVGASTSDSVREIYVGSLDAFPTADFPPADYIALGHIHRPQRVGGHEHIRYSGSPIPLSFDEAAQSKEMLLIDLDPGGLQAVTALPVPRFQPLIALRSNLADLPAAIGKAAAEGSRDTPAWLEITLVEDDYLADLPARVQAVCEGWPVEVLRLRRTRASAARIDSVAQETLDELSPDDVFARRLALETLDDAQQQALKMRHDQILHTITAPDANAGD